MASEGSTRRPRKLATWAGWFYLLIILTSVLSLVFLGGKYTVMGDSAISVSRMFENAAYVRINAVYEVFMFSAVIVLAVLLFELTEQLNPVLARTALLLRTAEALLGYLGVILTLGILSCGSKGPAVDDAGAFPILLYDLKDLVYKVLMVCISLGTILFMYLLHQAKYIPRPLTIWGISGFTLMILASLLQIMDHHAGIAVNGIAAFLVIPFELAVGLWLIIKGVAIDR